MRYRLLCLEVELRAGDRLRADDIISRIRSGGDVESIRADTMTGEVAHHKTR